MRCAKCRHKIRGATWYCPNCGAPVDDLNVADSVHPTIWSRPWVRLLSAALAMFALAGVVALVVGLLRARSADVRRAAAPTATPPPPYSTDAGPVETLVAASQLRPSRYPDGAVDAPPEVATFAAQQSGSPAAAMPLPATSGPTEASPTEASAPPAEPPSVPTRATPRSREGAPVWTVPRTSGTLQMDGWLDDWPTAPLPIDTVVFGQGSWTGADDLSASARLAWDEQMLYVGVEVIDDTFSQTSTGGNLHLGDGIELQLDGQLAADFDDGTFNADDWQIGISPGDLEGRPPEVYAWRPIAGPVAGVRLGARATEQGYVLEAALPWAAFDINPRAIDTIGASLNISDNDSPEPAQQTMIASSPRRTWGDPRTLGTWALGR
ncbi:MAG: sugar-binding protein [Ardenticatenales bacterium]